MSNKIVYGKVRIDGRWVIVQSGGDSVDVFRAIRQAFPGKAVRVSSVPLLGGAS